MGAREPDPPGPGARVTSTPPPTGRGVLLAVSATFWAALFLIPYQTAVQQAPRGSVMAAMLISAATFNQIIALITEGRAAVRIDPRSLGTAGWMALATVLGNGSIAIALPSIGPGMTSVVMKSQVLITPLLSMWLLSERAPTRLWVGGGLALVGFAVPQLVGGAVDALEVGYLWALGAAIAFAAMQVFTSRRIAGLRIPVVNATRLWMSALVLLALPAAWGGGDLGLDLETWGLAAAAGVLGPGISRLCLMTALRYITASTTALIALVGPIFAFVLGWLAFGDLPTGYEVLGAALILAGVLWPMLEGASLAPRRRSL